MDRVMLPPSRIGINSLCLLAVTATLTIATTGARAQAGALYRCGNEYTNTLSESEASGRRCVKLANAEWVSSGSDPAGRQYTYNDRRTVFREDGTVETWLQVAAPAPANADPADRVRAMYIRAVSPQVVRCRQRTVSSGATYFLDVRDNSVTKESSLQSALFPPPEVVAETLVRQLCTDRHGTERALASR
jgi:hypothetical protein